MLPSMQPMIASRTKRARATKSFEVVRVGNLQLFFSHYELIGFQFDEQSPVVAAPTSAASVSTPSFVRQHRLRLESDERKERKWHSRVEFERKWNAVKSVLL